MQNTMQKAARYETLQKRLSYHDAAEKINAYYFTKGEKTSVSTIRETLEAIDFYLPKYFPNGPYQKKDFIALAMAESGFDQYLVGTRKEFGIFQIMPEMCKDLGVMKNQFEVSVNTDMAMAVMKDKFDERKDYKKAIIAYNGYFYKKDGKLYDAYWKRFSKFRRALDDIFPDTTPN